MKVSDADAAAIAEMYQRGFRVESVVILSHHSRSTVYRVLHRLKIPLRRRFVTEEDEAEIEELRYGKKYHLRSEIARKTGWSWSTIRRALDRIEERRNAELRARLEAMSPEERAEREAQFRREMRAFFKAGRDYERLSRWQDENDRDLGAEK